MPSAVRTSRPRRGTRTKLLALTGAVAMVAAACTSSGSSDSGAPLPGITDDAVKIGYLYSDTSGVQGSLGFNQANYGDTETNERAIRAVVDWVNQNGGAGGRQIEVYFQPFDGSLSSPEQTQAICASFTQDQGVFAAVLDGQYHNNTLPCYRGANTLAIDLTITAHDQAQFEEFDPYLWSPVHPEYGSFLKTQLKTLVEQGFFEGTQGVQLMPSQDEVSRRVTESIAKPYLAENNIPVKRTDYVDSTNTGTLGQTAKAALVAGKSAGTDRVVVIGGARILPVVLADYEANDYESRWAITTFDNPAFVQNNGEALVGARRVGMTGIGYSPSIDVSTDKAPEFPDPANPNQGQCMDIITAAGAAPPTADDGSIVRENWRNAFLYCDATMFMKAAMDNLAESGDISAQDFKEAVAKISGYQSSLAFGATWGPGVYAGNNVVRELTWDNDNKWFSYTSEPITLEAPTVVADPEPTGAESPADGTPAGTDSPADGTPTG